MSKRMIITKLPLLERLPRRLRAVLTSSVGYRDLQFSCTLKNVAKEFEKQGFRYWVSSYHHIPRSPLLLSPSFFIVAIKVLEAIKKHTKQ